MKTYKELIVYSSFEERLAYLRSIKGVGEITFGHRRYLNQVFYRSLHWRRLRDVIIIRDRGCDLGCPGYEIHSGLIIIHHMNPLTTFDIENSTDALTDPLFLITTTLRTHQLIHYGGEDRTEVPANRTARDHILW